MNSEPSTSSIRKYVVAHVALCLASTLLFIGLGGCGGSGTSMTDSSLASSSIELVTSEISTDATLDEGRAIKDMYPGMLDLYFDQTDPAAVNKALVAAGANKPVRFQLTTIPYLNGNYSTAAKNIVSLVKLNKGRGIKTTLTLYLEHHTGLSMAQIKDRAAQVKNDIIVPAISADRDVVIQVGSFNEDRKKWSDTNSELEKVAEGIGYDLTLSDRTVIHTETNVGFIRCPDPGTFARNGEKVFGTKSGTITQPFTFKVTERASVTRNFKISSEWHGDVSKVSGFSQYSNDGIMLFNPDNRETALTYDKADSALDSSISIQKFQDWVSDLNGKSSLEYASMWRPDYHLWTHIGRQVRKPTPTSGRRKDSTHPGFGDSEAALLTTWVAKGR